MDKGERLKFHVVKHFIPSQCFAETFADWLSVIRQK